MSKYKTFKVICDECAADITYTHYSSHYNICVVVLSHNATISRGEGCTDIIKPPPEEEKDFCDLECLKKWVEKL